MPFRHAFRSYSSANDIHMVSLPLNESLEQWPEQVMDFTGYPQLSTSTTANKAAQGERLPAEPNTLRNDASSPPSAAYQTNAFTFPQLMDMESDVPSLDASRTSSIATASLAASEPDIVATSQDSLPEKMCPLLAGEIDSCQPSRCGPDAPCMNFTNLPPIEDCTSVPCISPPVNEGTTVPQTVRQPQHVSTRQKNRSAISREAPALDTSISSTRQKSSPAISSESPLPKRGPPSVAAPQPRSPRGSRSRTQPAKESNKTHSKVAAKQRAKAAHSLVEKKYRENLNTQLAMLHTTIQNAYYGPRRAEAEPEFVFDAEIDLASNSANASTKFRKSEVLSDAMKYINQTEVEMRHMENEIQRLSERVRTLEKTCSI